MKPDEFRGLKAQKCQDGQRDGQWNKKPFVYIDGRVIKSNRMLTLVETVHKERIWVDRFTNRRILNPNTMTCRFEIEEAYFKKLTN